MDYLKAGRRFRTLVDIGANDGAFGEHLRSVFDIGRVIAFEPTRDSAEKIRRAAGRNNPRCFNVRIAEDDS